MTCLYHSVSTAVISCVQVDVVQQVPQLPPVINPASEVNHGPTQLISTLALNKVTPATATTTKSTQTAACMLIGTETEHRTTQ